MKGQARWVKVLLVAVILLVLGCGCCAMLFLVRYGLSSEKGTTTLGLGRAVAIIDVKGILVSGEGQGFDGTGRVYAEDVIRDIKAAEKNVYVRAIVLDIDSPGGTTTASADIYRALKATKKPIVASFGETAASGGYYIACAARKIVVRPTTLTGSIGVRWEFINAQKLLEKVGVELTIIKGGKLKDIGGYHRPMTPEETAIIQAIVQEAYNEFVAVVAEGRGLPEGKVRELADGRLYSGRQALGLGLADSEGDLEQAIKLAAELGGIKGEPSVLRRERGFDLFRALRSALVRAQRPAELVLLDELLGTGDMPRLQYLYVAP